MSLHKSSVIAAALLSVVCGSVIWLAVAADHAMDKAGFGSLAAWMQLNTHAAAAFSLAVVAWLSVLGVALLRRGSERSQLLSVCALALAVSPVVWLVAVVA